MYMWVMCTCYLDFKQGKARKTKRFAEMKRMINLKDTRMWVNWNQFNAYLCVFKWQLVMYPVWSMTPLGSIQCLLGVLCNASWPRSVWTETVVWVRVHCLELATQLQNKPSCIDSAGLVINQNLSFLHNYVEPKPQFSGGFMAVFVVIKCEIYSYVKFVAVEETQ